MSDCWHEFRDFVDLPLLEIREDVTRIPFGGCKKVFGGWTAELRINAGSRLVTGRLLAREPLGRTLEAEELAEISQTSFGGIHVLAAAIRTKKLGKRPLLGTVEGTFLFSKSPPGKDAIEHIKQLYTQILTERSVREIVDAAETIERTHTHWKSDMAAQRMMIIRGAAVALASCTPIDEPEEEIK